MRNRQWIVIAVIVPILFACNFPSNQTTPSPLSSPTVGTPPSIISAPTRIPIETLLALHTPTALPTVTRALLVALPKGSTVNCRSGPATSYTVVGELKPGRQAEIIGKNIDVTWWYVKNPSDPSVSCWLFADVVTVEGNVESLPVVNPLGATVTAVTVSIEPPVMNVACDAFPKLVTINVRISASGPSTVFWRWEELSTGDVSEEQSLLFEEGGTKTVQDLYQVRSARDYTMVVRTTQPNEATGRTTFKAVCTP
jgi:uncharacterized protein YraI